MSDVLDRLINVDAVDRSGNPLPGTAFHFHVQGKPVGDVPRSDGRGSLTLKSYDSVVTVVAKYQGKAQSAKLAQNQNHYTFRFDLEGPAKDSKLETILAFVFGVLAMGVVAYAALRGVDLSPQGFFLIRLIGSIGAAGIGAVLPGFLHVEALWKKIAIRAGGALALAVLYYVVNPPALGTSQPAIADSPPPPATSRPR